MSVDFEFGIPRRRPVFMPRWARPIALSFLVIAYAGFVEGQEPLYAALFAALGLLLVVYSFVAASDPDYSPHFPYPYIKDLTAAATPAPSRTYEPLEVGGRLVLTASLTAGLWWALGRPFMGSDSLPAQVGTCIAAIWAWQIPYRPRLWTLLIAGGIGGAGGFSFAALAGLLAVVFSSKTGPSSDLFLALSAVLGVYVFILLNLLVAGRRYPATLSDPQIPRGRVQFKVGISRIPD